MTMIMGRNGFLFCGQLLIILISGAHAQRPRCIQGVTCELPDCFCSNIGRAQNAPIPGGLNASDVPQIIMFAFDDAVNVQNFGFYERLFPPERKNPNGCPIGMTLFVSHNWTDYDMVNVLYNRGMEIAVHSVTHRTPIGFWKTISVDDMRLEVLEQKINICQLGRVPWNNIRGWRSPFVQPSGDVMFRVLVESQLHYDSTLLGMSATAATPQQWPFTLDFGYRLNCVTPPCPRREYPGFWEIPIVRLQDLDDVYPCTYLDGCYRPPADREEAVELLMKNFDINYKGLRAPLYINLHSAWFSSFIFRYRVDAVEEFISRVLEKDDVYILTYYQGIEWMRKPTPLSEIKTFKPWLCAP